MAYQMDIDPQDSIFENVAPDNSLISTGLGDAPSGYGEMYDQLFANNPYRNLQYKETGWQKFLSSLGFRTSADKFREEAQVNAAEYDAGIFSQMQQNQFNSPVEQAQRMRAAGQNPDLLGTGDVASAASPVEDPNGMNPEVGEGIESAISGLSFVSSVSQNVLNLVPSIMSFATNLSSLKGIRLENDQKELAFNSGAIDYATKFFTEGITENDYRDAFEKNDWTNILDAAKKDSDYLAQTLFSSPQARKRFKLTYGRHANSMAAELSKYKTYDEYEKARKSLLTQRASQFFSDDNDTMYTLLQSFTGPLERYTKRVYEINERRANLRDPNLEQRLENKQMANQLAYEQAIDPILQAQAENTANERVSQENEIMNATNDLFADILRALGDYDNWWSSLAKAAVGIMRAQVMSQMHIQFGRQSHYKVNGDTGVMNEEGSSKFSIGF